MINYVLDGFNHGKSVMIISEKPDEVGDSIINQSFKYQHHIFIWRRRFFRGKKEDYLINVCVNDKEEESALREVITIILEPRDTPLLS